MAPTSISINFHCWQWNFPNEGNEAAAGRCVIHVMIPITVTMCFFKYYIRSCLASLQNSGMVEGFPCSLEPATIQMRRATITHSAKSINFRGDVKKIENKFLKLAGRKLHLSTFIIVWNVDSLYSYGSHGRLRITARSHVQITFTEHYKNPTENVVKANERRDNNIHNVSVT